MISRTTLFVATATLVSVAFVLPACTIVNQVDKYEVGGGAGTAGTAGGAGGPSQDKPTQVNGGLTSGGRLPTQRGAVRLLSGSLSTQRSCGDSGTCVSGSIR